MVDNSPEGAQSEKMCAFLEKNAITADEIIHVAREVVEAILVVCFSGVFNQALLGQVCSFIQALVIKDPVSFYEIPENIPVTVCGDLHSDDKMIEYLMKEKSQSLCLVTGDFGGKMECLDNMPQKEKLRRHFMTIILLLSWRYFSQKNKNQQGALKAPLLLCGNHETEGAAYEDVIRLFVDISMISQEIIMTDKNKSCYVRLMPIIGQLVVCFSALPKIAKQGDALFLHGAVPSPVYERRKKSAVLNDLIRQTARECLLTKPQNIKRGDREPFCQIKKTLDNYQGMQITDDEAVSQLTHNLDQLTQQQAVSEALMNEFKQRVDSLSSFISIEAFTQPEHTYQVLHGDFLFLYKGIIKSKEGNESHRFPLSHYADYYAIKNLAEQGIRKIFVGHRHISEHLEARIELDSGDEVMVDIYVTTSSKTLAVVDPNEHAMSLCHIQEGYEVTREYVSEENGCSSAETDTERTTEKTEDECDVANLPFFNGEKTRVPLDTEEVDVRSIDSPGQMIVCDQSDPAASMRFRRCGGCCVIS